NQSTITPYRLATVLICLIQNSSNQTAKSNLPHLLSAWQALLFSILGDEPDSSESFKALQLTAKCNLPQNNSTLQLFFYKPYPTPG
ncbi:hypothetical protein, partial [Paenibacillus sp. JMULE4]|uniref:hypothetical protein n=1 Tax=Paenibacillus sp. JMULE4 TaxID=2518342 RepID=UPI001C2D4606